MGARRLGSSSTFLSLASPEFVLSVAHERDRSEQGRCHRESILLRADEVIK